MTKPSECRTKDGLTVGLIDALIVTVRVLKTRDLNAPGVQEALLDLRTDPDVSLVMGGNELDRLAERINSWRDSDSPDHIDDIRLADIKRFLGLLQTKESAWKALHQVNIAMLRS